MPEGQPEWQDPQSRPAAAEEPAAKRQKKTVAQGKQKEVLPPLAKDPADGEGEQKEEGCLSFHLIALPWVGIETGQVKGLEWCTMIHFPQILR